MSRYLQHALPWPHTKQFFPQCAVNRQKQLLHVSSCKPCSKASWMSCSPEAGAWLLWLSA